MKKFLLSLVALIITSACLAQDIIVQKNGSTIQAKVTKVTQTEVEYKKFSNQNGPTYTINKAEIYSINYANGEKETFQDKTPQNYYQQSAARFASSDDILNGINESNRLQKDKLLSGAKSWRTIGTASIWIGCIVGLGGATGMIFAGADDTSCYIVAGVGVGAGLLSGIICNQIANNKEDAAYSILASHILKYDFNIGKNSHLTAGVDLLSHKKFKEKTLGLGVSYSF